MRSVLGEDELGLLAISLFQLPLTSGTYVHYSSNLTGFFKFCTEHSLEYLATTPEDIARYIDWLGLRGTVSATSLTPYLSAINIFLQDHALPRSRLAP